MMMRLPYDAAYLILNYLHLIDIRQLWYVSSTMRRLIYGQRDTITMAHYDFDDKPRAHDTNKDGHTDCSNQQRYEWLYQL